MRSGIVVHTICVLTFCLSLCGPLAGAQEKPNEVVAKLESAIKQPGTVWNCEKVYTPQGEPGDESPRGTEYMFKCHSDSIDVTIFLFYGDTLKDAEKRLEFSQRLQVNESKPITGIGEQGYALSKPRFAWVTFKKSRVFCQVNVAAKGEAKSDGPTQTSSVPLEVLREAAFHFARLVAEQIPLKE